MEALLTAVVLWLSANFQLPATDRHPKIEYATPLEIAVVRYGATTTQARDEIAARLKPDAMARLREVMAVYDDRRDTIMLQEGWTGRTPAELSILVHEMVHHLQRAAGMIHECPAARERVAYAAREKWLGMFGESLESAFEIDAFTLKVSTMCGF
jgi:uncharacterized protein DUF6647